MVPKTLTRVNPGLTLALGSLLLACQASDLTLPSDGLPANLREVSGSGQRGTVGSQLADPLVVQVTDAANRPVVQAALRFETPVPAAEILPSEVTTDSSGKAEVRVRLGSIEGIQTFDAQLANASDLRTTFSVIAVADQPAGGGAGGEQPAGGGNGGRGDGGRGDDDHGGHEHGEHGHDKHDHHGHGHGDGEIGGEGGGD